MGLGGNFPTFGGFGTKVIIHHSMPQCQGYRDDRTWLKGNYRTLTQTIIAYLLLGNFAPSTPRSQNAGYVNLTISTALPHGPRIAATRVVISGAYKRRHK
jgi:hypothetical protein